MNDQLTISILCDGGIGNRMNSLIAGLILAKNLNKNPIIYWPLNNWCECPFDDLFDTDLEVSQENINEVFCKNLNSYFMVISNPTVYQSIKYLEFSNNSIEFLKTCNENFVYMNNKLPDMFLKADCYKILSNLSIKKEILDKANKFILENNINNQVVAVHIRLTDNTKQVNVDQVFDQISQNKQIRYFVCSDDQDTEIKFSQLPNVVIHNKNNFVEKLVDGSWNETITDKEGRTFNFNVNRPKDSIIEALIDVLILSKCNLSNKQAKSTFYQLAKLYSGVRLKEQV